MQLEFNRLMKRLENARTKHAREQVRLDQVLDLCIRELMPLIEDLHRANRDLVFAGKLAMDTLKLTKKRRQWFADLLSGKASDLLTDSAGLGGGDLERLQAIVDELGPCLMDQRAKEDEEADFDFLRAMMEEAARNAGVDLDLSDLDLRGDPAEFERQLHERMGSASEAFQRAGEQTKTAPRRRKPTKAQLEKERRLREQEEAKTRDFKTLFKQLAKALHPDLEIDPVLKQHKEIWMKRLTTAYASGDLHDMLQIEMEWLGEEAGNLANAGDAKLKIYCTVLKEQIANLRHQTEMLPEEPQYGPLGRFRDPFHGGMRQPIRIKLDLEDEIHRHRDMLRALAGDDSRRREMIHDWADAHARASREPRFPF